MTDVETRRAILARVYVLQADDPLGYHKIGSLVGELGIAEADLARNWQYLVEKNLVKLQAMGAGEILAELTPWGISHVESEGIAPPDVVANQRRSRRRVIQILHETLSGLDGLATVDFHELAAEAGEPEERMHATLAYLRDTGLVDWSHGIRLTAAGQDEAVRPEEAVMPAKAQPDIFETMSDIYTVVGILGHGGMSTVFEVTTEDGEHLALKSFRPEAASRVKIKRFQNEIHFCARRQHTNIISVLDWGFREQEGTKLPFCVMPLYAGSLRDTMESGLSPSRTLVLFDQALRGVEAAHLLGIVHRDLKPENILVDATGDHLVVTDFGAAHFAEELLHVPVETRPQDRLANFRYASPEQQHGDATRVGKPTDVFALGLILNELFTGVTPHGQRYKTIAESTPEYGYLDDLVAQMLLADPSARPTITDVRDALIASGNAFVERQRLDGATGEVVPSTTVSDSLVSSPIRIVDTSYSKGMLTFTLSAAPNRDWIECFRRPSDSYRLPQLNLGPEVFDFTGDTAQVRIDAHFREPFTNSFIDLVPLANRSYAARRAGEAQDAERQRRANLERQAEDARVSAAAREHLQRELARARR